MAQVSRATFTSTLSSKINDNVAGEITAQDVREMFTDLEDSAIWYDEIPVSSVNSATGAVVLDADDIDDTTTTHKFATSAELSKLAGIESGANVTDAANVETAIEAITLTAVSGATGDEVLIIDATDGGLKAVLWENLPSGGGGAVDSVNGATGTVVLDADDIDDTSTTNKFATAAELSKLAGIETGATADQSASEIKTAYESNADTNALTDALLSKLNGIETGADVTDAANVETAIEAITLTAVSGATGDEVLIVDATDGGLKAVLWQNLPGSGGGISNVVEDTTPQLGGNLDTQGNSITGGLIMPERADHAATPTAGSGEIWISNAATQLLYFTDDTGTDREILTSSSGTTLTAKTSPIGADSLMVFDSADGDEPKESTLTQVMTSLDIATKAVTVTAQTGTTYTLALTDQSRVVTMSNAGANTLTIPTNASVAFPTGSVVVVQQIGAGATTIAGATGVTVNGVSAGSGDISAQWGAVSLLKTATDTWLAMGSIGTVA